MTDEAEVLFQDINRICRLMNSVTKMDVRLINQAGNPIFQIVNYQIPSVIQNMNHDYFLVMSLLDQQPINRYCYYVNLYGLEYITAKIWNEENIQGLIMIGPFISSTKVVEFMNDIILDNQLPVSQRPQLRNFYESLPVLNSNEYEAIGEMLVNLCHHKPIQVQKDTISPQRSTTHNENQVESLTASKNEIELRYEFEGKFMDAISKGNSKVLSQLTLDSLILAFSNRIPESPIRSAKNICLVANTLCRKAAEQGGVHPVYLHHKSEKFAIMIERTVTLDKLNKLMALMVSEYCEMVNTLSSHHYSLMVKKAVDYIHFNLENPLTLQEIADAIHVNSTHLSRKFKEDTDLNVIEYIHLKRVEEAKLYLVRGNKTITDIAFLVGFNDVNYFTRIFKKITSLTPSQFKKKIKYTGESKPGI